MNTQKTAIELLAPAKNIECGIAAINHGADAVYIGAQKYGARKMAGNSLSDIESLVNYAHKFNVKVYVTLNTLLFDHELKGAEQLIHELYKIGVDALIVQDMGILEMDLPPIPLHASTQTNNQTPEKVAFLEQAGFEQVVLARELSLKQIESISNQTNAQLEFFIHGALCVSYSGQCYMSQAINNRSANRGECGQPCRLKYNLTDNKGTILERNKHLLSLKDLNLSDQIEDLIKAGITSFKIEGRLKDVDYVSNITAYYRKKIDQVLVNHDHLIAASTGKPQIDFTPAPEKSFNRGFTQYFVNGRQKDIWSVDSPKSLGEKIGRIARVEKNYFTMDDLYDIHNGDGLCFFSKKKELFGVKVNKVEGDKIFPLKMDQIYSGATIFRNLDQKFQMAIKKSSPARKIAVSLKLTQPDKDAFELIITDEDNFTSTFRTALPKSPANNPEAALIQTKKQLSKMGNTIFTLKEIEINTDEIWFLPAAQLNNFRRLALAHHEAARLENYTTNTIQREKNNYPYPEKHLSESGNVLNEKARAFYSRHGVESMANGYEKETNYKGKTLMTTKHCILYYRGECLKETKKAKPNLPYYLSNEKDSYQLEFDCKNCQMKVIKA
ncbi:U32 family peptidase [Marinilabiliaceae bacterium JC017]|nr:U32 family peptidase [Marinilabiliaceae bacterium JC017]